MGCIKDKTDEIPQMHLPLISLAPPHSLGSQMPRAASWPPLPCPCQSGFDTGLLPREIKRCYLLHCKVSPASERFVEWMHEKLARHSASES